MKLRNLQDVEQVLSGLRASGHGKLTGTSVRISSVWAFAHLHVRTSAARQLGSVKLAMGQAFPTFPIASLMMPALARPLTQRMFRRPRASVGAMHPRTQPGRP